jgi:indole-3-glycerol phosphate synthase
MATYLDRILAAHRQAAAADTRSLDRLLEAAEQCTTPGRGFRAALESASGLAVIAEIKRRSPAKGDLLGHLVVDVLAKEYAGGGATCLSVLTDAEFFRGSAADLIDARAATGLPVLRKDFTVGPADVCDARLMGADAVLLIVAALSSSEVQQLAHLAARLGLDALVEVHDEPELEVALGAGATVVGVNQRDLATFRIDPARAERLASVIPAGVVRVAESGIRGPDDARRLAAAGYDAILVGETLVTAPDPAAAVAALRGH